MARERPKLSAKRWAETADSGFTPTVVKLPDGVSFFQPKKAGTYRLEIVPYEVPDNPRGGQNPNAQSGELHYERTYFSHRGIGADEKSYVCPARTAGKPCPICEHRKELMRDKDADEDLIKALAPKQRQLWNVYDHGDAEKGVQIWDVSFHLFGKQLKAAVLNADEDDKYEYFADPEDGLTLRVGMEEKSFAGNSFLEAASIGFKARKEPLAKEILDAAQPLDDLLILLEHDKLKSIFLQEEGVEHQDDDDNDGRKLSKDLPSKKGTEKKSSQEEGLRGAKSLDDDDKPAPKREAKPVTASDLGIGKGDDCRFAGKNWMIIRVAEDGLTVTLSNDDDDVKKGVPVADLQPPAGQDEIAPEAKKPDPTKTGGIEKPTNSTKATGKAGSDDEDWDAEGFDEPKKDASVKEQSKKAKKVEPVKEDPKKDAKESDWDEWD